MGFDGSGGGVDSELTAERGHKLRLVVRMAAAAEVVVEEEEEGNNNGARTPTTREARIDQRVACPAAPRKRRSAKWNGYGGGVGVVREYLSVPDLESVFVRHQSAAN